TDRNPHFQRRSISSRNFGVKMDEEILPNQPSQSYGSAGELSAESATAVAPPPDLPSSLDIPQLQAMSPNELDALCRRMEVRKHPGRSRHHEILDLVRCALSQNIPVTTEGFFEQLGESFGLLRSPALNFLPVPEDVA